VLRRVALAESPRHLSLASGGRVLVPAERSNELIEVRLPGGATRSVEVGEFPHDAAASSGRVFVGNEFGDTITVLEDGEVAGLLEAPAQPGGLATPSDGELVVVAVAERVVRSYDASTLEQHGTVSGGVGPTHAVSGCDRRAYVADTGGEAVLVYEVEPELRRVDRVELSGGPYGIALDCRRGVLWVTLPGENRLVALRLPGRAGAVRELASFATVRQPNSVAADPRSGRVFVAGRDSGTLQILNPRPGER
ncbi:MAG: YncE family protein, partial [Solirubrobacterales bacterium]